MFARIYRPARNAMQSGKSKTGWRLEFDATAARRIDPLMGWTSASDMDASELRLEFASREEAIAYAEKRGIPYQVQNVREPDPVVKAYSDNFAYKRRAPWTH